MLNQLFTDPSSFFVWFFALLVAITIHEYSHAFMADQLGDPTPRLAGRLTLNPFAHLDLMGTLMLLLFRFGWGKPVPIDPFNLRNVRRDAALISLSGPASNLILATFLSMLFRLLDFLYPLHPPLLISQVIIALQPIIVLNVFLGVFNLIPLHPLDGGKILVGFLPSNLAQKYDEFLNQYSLIFLIFLLLPLFGFSLISLLLSPIINLILTFFLPGSSLI